MCGWSGIAKAAATFEDSGGVEYTARRCDECGSVKIVDQAKESSPDSVSIDHYLEYGVGVGTIVEELGRVDPNTVTSFLDVGCNYGLSLAFANVVYGWEVLGIEPSRSAPRGAAELGVTIVEGYLEEDTDLGRQFDLILSSEVLEHVPDPNSFLRAIKAHLAPGGTILLTTPAADIVVPNRSDSEALLALSAGYHTFLASADALRALLTRLGFQWVQVELLGGSLRAMARVEPAPPAMGKGISQQTVEKFYRSIVKRQGASSLRLGAAARLLRSLVARGDFAHVDAVLPALTGLVRQRYGVDLDSPEDQLRSPSGGVPGALPGIAFALGMIELLHSQNNRRAAAFFELSGRAIDVWLAAMGAPDLDLVDLREQSAFHCLLAMVRVSPDGVVAGAIALAEQSPIDRASGRQRLAARRARLLVELASHDADGDHLALAQLVAPDAERLTRSDDREEVLAGRDALYALALEAHRRGDTGGEREWLQRTMEACDGADAYDEHALALARLCRAATANNRRLGVSSWRPDAVKSRRTVGQQLQRAGRVAGRVRRRALRFIWKRNNERSAPPHNRHDDGLES